MAELDDFVLTFCRLAGGLVDRPTFAFYEVLWPEPVADKLGVPTYQRLAFREEEEERGDGEVIHVGYGHPLVEVIVEETLTNPSNAILHANAVRLQKPGLADVARQTLALSNARLTVAPKRTEERALHHYVRYTFKAALITDEKHEQLVSVVTDAQNGYAVPELADIEHQIILEEENAFKNLRVAPARWTGAETDPLSRSALEGLLKRAMLAARDALSDPIAHLTRRATRFLELDRARLEQYYGDIERDLKRRRDRATNAERRAGFQDKLDAARSERQAKLVDVEAKYRLRVELELLNLLVITVPKLTLQVQIGHRSAGITRTVVWNPLLRQIEPLPCDVCGRPATRLTLCSGDHLVHTEGDCLLAEEQQCVDCKRIFCQLCADVMKVCVVCERPVCRHSLNHCDACGRGVCREHVGLCHADDGAPVRIETRVEPAPAAEPEPPPEPAPAKAEQPRRLSSARRQAAERAASKRRQAAAPKVPRAAKIEVYVDPNEPVVTAVVLSSGNTEIAVRTWERIDAGIAVWCDCEKGWRCPANRKLLELDSAVDVDLQVWRQVGALRGEYDVPPKKVSIYEIIRGYAHPVPRLVLRGRWKE
jgi:hypothetical protein